MRALLLVLLSAGLAVGCASNRYDRYGRSYPASARVDNGGQTRYVLCHKGQTRTLPEPAVRAHLNHGDRFGRCGRNDRGRGNDNNGRGNRGRGRN